MRFIHTADWHLGRLLNGAHLTSDQAFALDGLIALTTEIRPDAVIVAGDVYDRSVPPPEAVALLDETLTRLAATGTAVIVIAGNHDGAERLGFGARMLRAAGVHIAGPLNADVMSVLVETPNGATRVWALPYADPAFVRAALDDEALRGHDEAVGAMLDRVRGCFVPGERNVLVAHEFAAGGVETADSERPLTVGGTAQVALERFAGFDYVALGHLHRPQALAGGRARYAGSLLKYSVAECDHEKSVAVVELKDGEPPLVRLEALPVRRDVRTVRGRLKDLVGAASAEGRDDYVYAVLSDTEPLFDPMGELRSVWPNCIGFERDRQVGLERDGAMPELSAVRAQDVASLFGSFFERVTGERLTVEQRAEFAASVDAVAERDRGR